MHGFADVNWHSSRRGRVSRCSHAADKVLNIIKKYFSDDELFRLLSFVGLFTIVIGSGGIKSNQNVFGGNQFTLPGDGNLLNSYFSMQYFILKCGLLSGQILVPIFRKDVQCFGMDDCYPLAFTVPSILMLLSFLILLAGKSVCIHEPPNENMFLRVCRCILVRNNVKSLTSHLTIFLQNGMKQKVAQRNVTKKDHWLDYAEEKYGAKLVMETKMVLNVLTLFLPLPIFWALLAQVNSRWVFQATKMNGDIGSYTIQPDQMGMVTSIFIIVLIPIFDQLVYPVLAKVGIKSPLHKITCGFICSSLAFVVAAIVEWNIEDNYINILWLLPQYFIIAMAEVLLWIAVLNFIFTQAPDSMKSVLTAFVYSTVAGGSLIVIIISGANFFNSQFIEYLFYIGLMIFNTFFFLMLSKRYKFVDGTK